MALTQYGAVADVTAPNQLEIMNYFQGVQAQKDAMKLKKEQLAYERAKQTQEAFDKATKPLNDFKANTGISNPTADQIVNTQIQDSLVEAARMKKDGKPDDQIAAYVQQKSKDIQTLHNYYVNARESIDKQLDHLKDSGLPLDKLKDLALNEILFQKDDKGNTKWRTSFDPDIEGIVAKTARKYADTIDLVDEDKVFNFERNVPFKSDESKLKAGDGTITNGVASVNYNPVFQEVKKDGYEYKVVDKTVPLVKNGEPVLGKDGKPIEVLTPEGYLLFSSHPGISTKIEGETQRRMKAAEKEVADKADKEYAKVYGKYSKQLLGKNSPAYKDIYNRFANGVIKDEDVVKQEVAKELASKYIPKNRVNVDKQRNPNTIINNNSGGKKDDEIRLNDIFPKLKAAAGKDGVVDWGQLDPTVSGAVFDQMKKSISRENPWGADKAYNQSNMKLVVKGDKVLIYSIDEEKGKDGIVKKSETLRGTKDYADVLRMTNPDLKSKQEILRREKEKLARKYNIKGKTYTGADLIKMGYTEDQIAPYLQK